VDAPAEPGYHRRKGLLITGIILAANGAIAAGAGMAIYGASGTSNTCDSHNYCYSESTGNGGLGIGLMVTGGILVVGGVPLLILGMIKVPNKPEDSAKSSFVPKHVALAPVVTHDTWGLQLSGQL
jgi:hypothetical protein